ncbi:sigma-70 family RNA polymerase sigma factor [Ktedonosporobacter rubrisoli]|uniref:Sigma-70 family RNA polymerase sigma factor n=1 Tax=Ktedonosporobacter rubrisoli TaxID=2509675 RepID=A0A4P6JYI3_KTERU|nr:bifunctional nuclease domain-containing protein [Ktedonosporobacter rubrisoli]QBD80868.1 sigma-70 family RNA polymerase sigma factor [Ktedonosporobacter rubrisoli]
MQENSDAHLVARALADDAQAFPLLIERYQAMAFYLARRSIGEDETARELVQEAFLQAYLSLEHLREAASFKSWFYGIVLNICRSWRRMHPELAVSLDTQAPLFERSFVSDPQELVEEHELRQMVRAALQTLTPKNQAVAYLFYYEDLSIQEIASRLNIAPSAVKNRLHKGRQQLSAQLQIHYPEIGKHTASASRKRSIMHYLKLVKAVQESHMFSKLTLPILLDEAGQRAWIPRLSAYTYMHTQKNLALEQDEPEPDTTDFLVDMLHALKGRVEEVAVEVLYEDLLYARVRLQGARGAKTLKARFEDALQLAIREQSPIAVAEEVLERQAIALSDYGETQPEQLASIEQLIEQRSYSALARREEASNLDFSAGLHGWQIFTPIQAASYQLDQQQRYQNKVSLRFTLQQEDGPHIVLLSYKSFSARQYRGKRLRVRAYMKAEGMPQPLFHMRLSGQFRHIATDEEDRVITSYNVDNDTLYIADSGRWTAHDLVMDIPEQAESITLNFVARERSKGTFWVDGVQLETVDKQVALSELSIDPPPLKAVNLDFAQDLLFWKTRGKTPWQYERGVDHSSASPAAYLKASVAAPDAPYTLQQTVSAQRYGGHAVRLSASVKTSSVAQQASLFLAARFGNSDAKEVLKGTNDWTRYELVLTIPANASGLSFGITLHGQGQIWLKDVQLQLLETSQQ